MNGERAAIVAWARQVADDADEHGDEYSALIARSLADRIEAGEHEGDAQCGAKTSQTS